MSLEKVGLREQFHGSELPFSFEVNSWHNKRPPCHVTRPFCYEGYSLKTCRVEYTHFIRSKKRKQIRGAKIRLFPGAKVFPDFRAGIGVLVEGFRLQTQKYFQRNKSFVRCTEKRGKCGPPSKGVIVPLSQQTAHCFSANWLMLKTLLVDFSSCRSPAYLVYIVGNSPFPDYM